MPKMWMEVIRLCMWTKSDQTVTWESDGDRAQTRDLDLISDED